jgi:long-chain acyl-CoA synthetase
MLERTLPPSCEAPQADGDRCTQTDDGAVLLTGATGFVGMEVLARYLELSDRDLVALVRASDDGEARARVRSTVAALFGREDAHPGRVTAVAADLEQPHLGLNEGRRHELAARVSDIIHAAASVSFTLPLEQSRCINVDGTRRLLEFALSPELDGRLHRFAYVSTAYVAGTHTGRFGEDELDIGQGFRNPYERSKFEAERLVRAHSDQLPVQIFRPSIVVGDRRTGWTASFNVLYSPLKAFARGALPALPALRSATVDVVSVDYVADAIFALASGPVEEPGETFALVAGPEATTVGRLTELSARELGRRPPPIVSPSMYRYIIHPVLKRRGPIHRRREITRSEVFFPYFTMRLGFDDRRSRRRLARHGIAVSPIEHYLHRLIAFAREADWGRRSVPRIRHRSGGRPVTYVR